MSVSLKRFLLLLLGAVHLRATDLHIDASRVLRPISPDWCGPFFEEITSFSVLALTPRP